MKNTVMYYTSSW